MVEPADAKEGGTMNDRMCIVSRQSLPADRLIRFVVGPDGSVVPDLKRRLPGRGAHVEARRASLELAVRRNLFRRAFKGEGAAAAELPETVDALLARSALGALGLCRKAGQIATGAAKVDSELRGGHAVALLQASDGAADGRRKVLGARHAATVAGRGPEVPVFTLFTIEEMSLALGGANVVHAAVLAGNAGAALLSRLCALEDYRGEAPFEPAVAHGRPAGSGEVSNDTDGSCDGAMSRMDEALGSASGQEAEV